MKASKNSQHNNLETVSNKHDKEIPKERCISPENYWWSEIIMEYQKIINLLDNTPNQPSKFRTKNWVEVNDEARGAYNTNG